MKNKKTDESKSVVTRRIGKGIERHFTGKYRENVISAYGRKIVQRVPVYSYMDEEMTISEFSEKYGLGYYTVLNRMKNGTTLGKILHGIVEHEGKEIQIEDLAKKLNTSVGHLKYNLSRGYPIDKPHATYSLKDCDGNMKEYRLVDIAEEYCKRNGCEKNHNVISMIRQRIISKNPVSIEELVAAKRN